MSSKASKQLRSIRLDNIGGPDIVPGTSYPYVFPYHMMQAVVLHAATFAIALCALSDRVWFIMDQIALKMPGRTVPEIPAGISYSQ